MHSFDQVYYINLEHRTDMYESINNVLKNLRIDPSKITRINAIKKSNGAYGCALSHIEALQDVKKNNYKKVLVLEDDFVPFDYEETIQKVDKFMTEVEDWDLVMLTCHLKQVEECAIENVARAINCQSTIAYAINSHFIDTILKVFTQSANMLSEIEHYQYPCPFCIDVNWKKLQAVSKWYAFYPILGKEYPKYSDVQNKFLSHF
jgi:glycosyl transferase family 25